MKKSKLINDMEMNNLLKNKYYTGQFTPMKMSISKIKDLNGIPRHESYQKERSNLVSQLENTLKSFCALEYNKKNHEARYYKLM